MKKLFLKLGILLFLTAGVSSLLSIFIYKRFTPFYWGNQLITDKTLYFDKNKNYFNVLFLGSSKTYHQIDVNQFDSIIKPLGKFHSLNFGIQGLLPPESFDLYEKLIFQDSVKLKYAFIELDWLSSISYRDLHYRRNYLWMDLNYYKFILNSTIKSSVPLQIKLWTFATRTINLLEKTFNIGVFNEIFNYYAKVNDQTGENIDTLLLHNGFHALNRDTASGLKFGFKQKELKDIQDVREASKVSYTDHSFSNNKIFNKIYLEKLNYLIEVSKKRGIHLIYIMPPQWKTYQYRELLPLFNQLADSAKISVADCTNFPELFEPKNLYDPNHLNYKGSHIYTSIIANKFITIVTNKKGYHSMCK